MIGVREVPPPGVPMDVGVSSLLLPLPGQGANSIVFEDRDGSNIKTFRASGFVYSENKFRAARAAKLNIAVFVTDARVALACTRYEKGGGWIGAGSAAILTIPLNAASMAKAAYMRRGKSLVGQVRYQSLVAVGSGYRPGTLSSHNYLSLVWKPTSNDRYDLQLTIAGGVDVSALAAEIARRAARYVLKVDPKLTDEEHSKIEPLLDAQPLQHAAGARLYYHNFLTYYKENESTARYGLGLTRHESVEQGEPTTSTAVGPMSTTSGQRKSTTSEQRMCIRLRCEARGLPTVLARCDLCGQPTQPL